MTTTTKPTMTPGTTTTDKLSLVGELLRKYREALRLLDDNDRLVCERANEELSDCLCPSCEAKHLFSQPIPLAGESADTKRLRYGIVAVIDHLRGDGAMPPTMYRAEEMLVALLKPSAGWESEEGK